MKTLEERFWEKVDKRGPDDCWEWLASKVKGGYGRIRETGSGPMVFANRFSFELAYGPLLEGEFCCHWCNNPGCVNPRHLYRDDHAGNQAYKVECGRSPRGSKHGNSKLTEPQVQEIRFLLSQGHLSQRRIASLYGVCQRTINVIKSKKGWGWLGETL